MTRTFVSATVAAAFLCTGNAVPLPAEALQRGPVQQTLTTVLPQSPELARRGAKRSHQERLWQGVRHEVVFPTQLQHIVVIVMENRTVDNLFAGYYGQPFNGGPATWDQVMQIYNPATSSQPLTQNSLGAGFDPNHGHDGGWIRETQNGFGAERFGCGKNGCPPGTTAYSYVPTSETGPYAQLVQNYASGDYVFQSNQGPSFVSHQYLIAAQSGGISGSLTAPLAESENPNDNTPVGQNWYEQGNSPDGANTPFCGGGFKVGALNMAGHEPQLSSQNAPIKPPCEMYGSGTILDEVVGAQGNPPQFDWQYVAHQAGGLWAAPTAVANLYAQYMNTPPAYEPFAVDPNAYNFVQNLYGKGNPQRPFAALTYLTPCPDASDHPGAMGVNTKGPLWLSSVVNAIGESPYWKSTAIVVTWDDWGGWFDHVPWVEAFPNAYPNLNGPPPNTADPNEWGYRVPLMLISPYGTYKGYVSHGPNTPSYTARSQSAITTMIESLFGLPTLHGDDYYANDPMLDMFNFKQNPAAFQPVIGLGTYQIPRSCAS